MGELEDYLAIANNFKLGKLDTEGQHPLSIDLSRQAVTDLGSAIGVLAQIDINALHMYRKNSGSLIPLAQAISKTLNNGNKIYLGGCGATGRLSLSIDVLCREGMLPSEKVGSVIGFMAGGDSALIRSKEGFEDHSEYGARQLQELGFKNGDLCIGTTEGGETSFVIGAVEYAAENSGNNPFILYCNPDSQLMDIERSRRFIENKDINNISLPVGPMSISGSTRMQASTVLMDAVGRAIMYRDSPESIPSQLDKFIDLVGKFDFSFLKKFIERESGIYNEGGFVVYKTDRFGIAVLTDTTERSPTFSLTPFENAYFPNDLACLCYLTMGGAKDVQDAWKLLLHRSPRCVEWDEYKPNTGIDNFYGYDISNSIVGSRKERTGKEQHIFEVMGNGDNIRFQLDELSHEVPIKGQPLLYQHLLLKLILNSHSTLVMGRMGRYEDNLMTFVAPTNNKLIDRAIRYVQQLYHRRTGADVEYETVASQLFIDRKQLQPNEPIVLKILNNLQGYAPI